MRSRPYRNPWIITAIRNLYFTGGHMSFAHRFRHLFPKEELNKVVKYEVPMPMVALVATAVCFRSTSYVHSMLTGGTFSCMLLSMSGVWEGSKLLNSPPIHTWTSIEATSTP